MAACARLFLAIALILCPGCAEDRHGGIVISISASNVGREGKLLAEQLRRFERTHPGVQVRLEETPDAADQRHQLYVQWLNAQSERPDVLQLDVIWTPEFAAAGWLAPLHPAAGEFFESTLQANRWRGRQYAVPWFVDVGMLYYRSDLIDKPPSSLAELHALAKTASHTSGVDYGLVWQNARYEGLITTFVEVLGGFGGRLLDEHGNVVVDRAPARRALRYMRQLIVEGVVPRQALGWQEEQTRFAFQNGRALFMRNWPYAYPLLQSDDSRVRGKFRVMPMPGSEAGSPTATLGGSGLAINARSAHPAQARELVRFLTAPEQMRERARKLGQLPPRPALFHEPELAGAFGAPPETMLRIVAHSVARPPNPLYSELSDELQVELHRALSGQLSPRTALDRAKARMQSLLDESGLSPERATRPREPGWLTALLPLLALALLGTAGYCTVRSIRRSSQGSESQSDRSAWWMMAPALAVLSGVALVPLVATLWQSLFTLDLRMPWRESGAPSLQNYWLLAQSPQLWGAIGRTLFFVGASVTLELCLGLLLALALHARHKSLGLSRAAVLIPWAIPTVVAGLVFRFLFEGPDSIANTLVRGAGLAHVPVPWLTQATAAWVPVLLADVWKTTPFVILLILAALSNIDQRLYEAAEVDGAYGLRKFVHITLPQLKPALLVVLLFRSLDALRVFDLVYVLTQGGPGTATQPLALYTFTTLFSYLRFGKGAALSIILVALAGLFALFFVRLMGADRRR